MVIFLKKNWLILFTISAIYFLYTYFFIKPWQFSNFSLTDDGQVLMQNASYLTECVKHLRCFSFFDQVIELGTNRHRPVYWVIQDFTYYLLENSATAHHLFRVYITGFLGVLSISVILLRLGVGWISTVLGSFLFFTNFSFSENVIRLGPNEPYQIIFLTLFLLIFFETKSLLKISKNKYLFLCLLFIWTVLIKETNIAILPALLITQFMLREGKPLSKRFLLMIIGPIFALVAIFLIKYFIPTSFSITLPVYTSNYVFSLKSMFQNSLIIIKMLLNSMSPILKICLLLTPIVFLNKDARKTLLNKEIIFWLLFSIFFIGIMFPWRYLLERYLLIGVFGISILVSIIIDKIVVIAKKFVLLFFDTRFVRNTINVVVVLLITNSVSRGFSLNLAKTINYANWYKTFTQFEADQINEMSKLNSKKVYINAVNNLNNWEFLYEIPIHKKFIYNIDPSPQLLLTELSKDGYIFSRSSLDSAVSLDEISKKNFPIVSYKSYYSEQIDPIEFRNKFTLKPIETLVDPPLQPKGYDYYWEVRLVTSDEKNK